MRIGIFGGSFNPPHNMHENIALDLIKNNILDKVIFVPTGSKYKYKNNLLSDDIRYTMIKIITDKYQFLEVSDYELKDNVVYSYQTLDYFKKIYPDSEIYFICGLDNLSYMDKWERGEYILNNYKILVVNRDSDDLEEVLNKFIDYRDNIIVSNILKSDVSSTIIRNNIDNREVFELLDPDVYQYILEHNLYKG